MYKHNASSIKETAEKMFISSEERTRWNNKADAVHDHNENHYTKKEMDLKLDSTWVSTQGSVIHVDTLDGGFTKNLEILGNTRQNVIVTVDRPKLEAGSIEGNNGGNYVVKDEEGNVLERYRTVDFIPVQYNDEIHFTVKDNQKHGVNVRYYDENKIFIRPKDPENMNFKETTVPFLNAKYIRFYADKTILDNLHVTITRTECSKYNSVGAKREDGSYELEIVQCGKNLYDPSKAVNGFIRMDPKTISEPDYQNMTSDFIPVEPNKTYLYSYTGYTAGSEGLWTGYAFYSDKNLDANVTNRFVTVGTNALAIVTPSNAKYIRIGSRHLQQEGVKVQFTKSSSGYNNSEEKNLFDVSKAVDGYLNSDHIIEQPDAQNKTSDFIAVEPNTIYLYSFSNYDDNATGDNTSNGHGGTWTSYIFYSDKDMNSRVTGRYVVTAKDNMLIATPSNAKYIRIGSRYLQQESVSVYFGKTMEDATIKPYTEKTTKILLPTQLEGIGNVRDRLFTREDGVVCIEKWIKDKSFLNPIDDDIQLTFKITPVAELTHLVQVRSHNLDHSQPLLCDSLPYFYNWDIDRESIFKPTNHVDGTIHTGIHIRVAKSKLPANPTKADVRKYVNTLNFKYISKEPEIIELGHIQDLGLSLDNGTTSFFINSPVCSRIKCSVPQSLSSTIDSQSEKIQQMRETVTNISKINQINNKLSVEVLDGFRSVKSTTNGYTSDMYIEGDTYSSVVHPRMFLGERKDFFEKDNGLNGAFKFSPDGFIEATKPEGNREYFNLYPKRKLFNVKSNRLYTMVIEVVHNTLKRTDNNTHNSVIYFGNSNHVDDSDHKTIFVNGHRPFINAGDVGVFKFLVRTRDLTTVKPDDIGDRIFIINDTVGRIKFRYALIAGDHTQNDAINSAFIGVNSVYNDSTLKLTSYNENLFDYTLYPRRNESKVEVFNDSARVYGVGEHSHAFQYFSFDCEPNTEYKLEMEPPNIVAGAEKVSVARVHRGAQVDDGKVLAHLDRTKLSTVFTSPDKFKGEMKLGIILYCNASTTTPAVGDITYKGIKISKVGYNTDTKVMSNNHKITAQLSQPLHSLPNGVKDTIEKIGDRYYVVRRCNSVTFDGSDMSMWEIGPEDLSTPLVNTTYFRSLTQNAPFWKDKMFVRNSVDIHSTEPMVPAVWETQYDTHGVYAAYNLDLKINKSELETQDLNGLKKYFEKTPLTVIYQLNEYKLEPLDIDINLRTFDGNTHFVINNGEAVLPKVKFTLPCNLSNSIKIIQDKLHALETKQEATLQMLLRSTFEADKTSYRFEIATFNSRAREMSIDYDLYEMYKYVINLKGYDRYDIENRIDFYTIIGKLTYDMADELFMMIENQHVIIPTE